jgi:hypothetical protein
MEGIFQALNELKQGIGKVDKNGYIKNGSIE